MTKKSPTPEDRAIGERLKQLRQAQGMSQTTLAEAIGVTFQQVQKYERGINRIGSGRLQRIAAVLGTTVSALYGEEAGSEPAVLGEIPTFLSTARGRRMIKAFINLPDKAQVALIEFAEAFAGSPVDEEGTEGEPPKGKRRGRRQ